MSAAPSAGAVVVRRSPWSAVVVVLMVASAFSPYLGVSLNIRYEHLIFYPAAGMLALSVLAGRRFRLPRPVPALLICWLTLGFLTYTSTRDRAGSGLGAVDPLAVADAFLLPASILVLAFSLTRSPEQSAWLLRVAAWTTVLALSINSLVIQAFEPEDIRDVLINFWSNPASGEVAVAEQALQGGRYGGIFNQPFDAGVGYSLGIAAWIYLFLGGRRTWVWMWSLGLMTLALLVSGGISAQSKTFIYGALFVLAVTIVVGGLQSVSRLGRITRQIAVVALAVLVAGWLGLVESFDRTIGLLTAFSEDPNERFSGLYGVTGGRTESVGSYFDRVVDSISLTGSGLVGAQDDAFISFLRGAGVLGFLLFVGVVLSLFTIARRQQRASAERILAFSIVSFIVVASFGATAIQANRGSTVFWILIGLLAGAMARSTSSGDAIGSAGQDVAETGHQTSPSTPVRRGLQRSDRPGA